MSFGLGALQPRQALFEEADPLLQTEIWPAKPNCFAVSVTPKSAALITCSRAL
jgi:hypothetical protein